MVNKWQSYCPLTFLFNLWYTLFMGLILFLADIIVKDRKDSIILTSKVGTTRPAFHLWFLPFDMLKSYVDAIFLLLPGKCLSFILLFPEESTQARDTDNLIRDSFSKPEPRKTQCTPEIHWNRLVYEYFIHQGPYCQDTALVFFSLNASNFLLSWSGCFRMILFSHSCLPRYPV